MTPPPSSDAAKVAAGAAKASAKAKMEKTFMASLLRLRPLFGSAVVFRLSLYALFMRILGGFMGPLCAQTVGSSTLKCQKSRLFCTMRAANDKRA
jgi:hypothetical protein